MTGILLRSASQSDGVAIADVLLTSRRHAMPYLREVHSDAEVRAWTERVLLPTSDVSVALMDGHIAGVSAVASGFLTQLYVLPALQGCCIGSRLLARAKANHPCGLHLYAFQRNTAARAFYERRGFILLQLSDGSENEEGEPDALYEWPGERN